MQRTVRSTPLPHKRITNTRGYTWLTPDLVVLVFKDSKYMRREDIAVKRNISPSSVATILVAPSWFVNRMERYAGHGWVYPVKVGE